MSNIALYTFGVLSPAMTPEQLADFSARGTAIYTASDTAAGFVGQAETAVEGPASHTPGEDFGPWGSYALPLDLPDFAGQDPHVHIATLSLWKNIGGAHNFVYQGIHRAALNLRYDWFVRGPWPGHVLWNVDDHSLPHWSDGVSQLEALAREGEKAEHFTFGSRWGRLGGLTR